MFGLANHLRNLTVPPVLDVRGEWAHLPNARVGSTSMDEGPLKDRCVIRHRTPKKWEPMWQDISSRLDKVILFTFVRNPWDRVCSAFYHCRDRARVPRNHISKQWEFTDWVKRVLASKGPRINMHFAEQYGTAFFRGERIGFVGSFENMVTDWKCLAVDLGVSSCLPHLNSVAHGCYVDQYDDESRVIVERLYSRDIKAFGYKFGK